MDSNSPRVSVVLPVCNGADTLDGALDAIVAQTCGNWELIVIDDGSTDHSGAIVSRLARRDSRVRLTRRKHKGLTPALQTGCALARGELIARMDADDWCEPDRFAAQLDYLDSHPEVALCGTQVVMTGAPGPGRLRYQDWLNPLQDHEDILRELFVECPIAHPTFMMRRAAFEKVGGYRAFDGPEDYDLVFRMWHAGFRLGNVPRPLLKWRDSPGRLSMRSPRYSEAAFRALKREWLARANLAGGRPLYQWGAGEVGKRWLREWPPGMVHAVADIRPSKIGQRIHGVPVIRPEALPPPGACFVVVAVGTPGARADIRAHAAQLGLAELKDFVFVA